MFEGYPSTSKEARASFTVILFGKNTSSKYCPSIKIKKPFMTILLSKPL